MQLPITISTLLLLIFSFTSKGQSFSNRSILGKQHAVEQVEAVSKSGNATPFYKPLISNKGVAIGIVEPILFSVYGKENIIKQRPYEAYLINGFWYIGGTLPKGEEGGTFEIVVEATNSRIVSLAHGK